MWRTVKIGLSVAGILAVIAAAIHYGGFRDAGGDAPLYRLATVERGRIASTVAASGTLKALVTVDVGTQVSGMIKTLHADFNSQVKAGQVIARIDSAPFEARLSQAEAELAVERARVAIQQSTLAELEAELDGHRASLAEAKEALRRKRSLFKRKVAPSSAVDTALANYKQAEARVKAALARLSKQKVQIELAKAQVLEKAAVAKQRQLDLDYTYIRSPVDGVVIHRNVDAGQTVAASLQAPVLFRIAQDLSRMQVEVSVDEADIGRVRVGQPTIFTVDSYPDFKFDGRVSQVRKAGTEVSNVVTYTVVVTADNTNQRLLPGMTANVTIIVNQRDDALKVPNAALRFRPPDAKNAEPGPASAGVRRQRAEQRMKRLIEQLGLTPDQQNNVRAIDEDVRRRVRAIRQKEGDREERSGMIARVRASANARINTLLTEAQRLKFRAMRAKRSMRARLRGRVWVVNADGKPDAVPVVYGISDGSFTEIVRGQLKEGREIIVGIAEPPADARRERLRFRF